MHVIGVRLSEHIRDALARAAEDDAIPPATAARQAIVRELQRRGYVSAPSQERARA